MQLSIYLKDLKKVSGGRMMIMFLEEKGENLNLKKINYKHILYKIFNFKFLNEGGPEGSLCSLQVLNG